MRRLGSRALVWAVLAAPGVWMLVAWWRGTTFYGEVLHASGLWGARLLIATLAVTPLRLAFPGAGWIPWLASLRRSLGVAAFGYSLLHALVYALRRADAGLLLEDAAEVAMWTGWVALLAMVPLAATSNDASVHRLGRAWYRLHRLVYLIVALTFAHWVLSAFDPVSGWIHLGVLAGLEVFRLLRVRSAPA